MVMLGEEGCGGRSGEVGSRDLDKAVLHKACRELVIGGSREHVMLVAREQEQQRERARERERLSGGCSVQHVRWRGRCRECCGCVLYQQATLPCLSKYIQPRDSAIW